MEQNQLGSPMILPDLILHSRVNQCFQHTGIDDLNFCLDKKHFRQYPHAISYQHNSRGFRDQEWPSTVEELKKCIWCFGDSFTVGVGSPLEHTWPYLLGKNTGRRVINVSMDGASNNWIARQIANVQKEINPTHIVVMWSYLHRRESNDHNKSDEERRIHNDKELDDFADLHNFKHCVDMVKIQGSAPLQLSVPDYTAISLDAMDHCWKNIRGASWPDNIPRSLQKLLELPNTVQQELKEHFKLWSEIKTALEVQSLLTLLENDIIKINRIDIARDGHHFDLLTAQWVVDQITNQLTTVDC
jgi:hypothetical protein